MAGSPHAPFRISSSQVVLDAVQALAAQCAGQGISAPFFRAMNGGLARLQKAPLDFGDPSYHLRGGTLEVRHAAFGGVGFRFAVDEENRIVHLLGVTPMAGLGLN